MSYHTVNVSMTEDEYNEAIRDAYDRGLKEGRESERGTLYREIEALEDELRGAYDEIEFMRDNGIE